MQIIDKQTNIIHKVIDHTKDGVFIVKGAPPIHRKKIKECDALVVDETCFYLLSKSGEIIKADHRHGPYYFHKATMHLKATRSDIKGIIKKPLFPML